jgi:S-adenosylmethionine synthetase
LLNGALHEGSIVVTVISTAVHEALGVVARRDAAQLNNLSGSTVRAIGYNEVHERGIIDENEAVCCDQRVESSTGIAAGINSSGEGREAEGHCGDENGRPKTRAHYRNPKPVCIAHASISAARPEMTQI